MSFLTKLKQTKYRIIASLVLVLLVGWIGFYIFLPAINLRSVKFWVYLTFIMLAAILPWFNESLIKKVPVYRSGEKKSRTRYNTEPNFTKRNLFLLGFVEVPLAVILIGSIFSSPFFFARQYASVIDVENGVFEEEMPEATEITNIALMDTESAAILGNRTLGALSDVVSQYNVSGYYTQINYNNSPKKVANLEYENFFKWIVNRDSGIPGMVMVDPVKSNAEYIKFSEPMKYATSGFFGDDLMRKLRFSYPTKIFHSVTFEVDENLKPCYTVSCGKPKVGLFGAFDIDEVIIFYPTDGSSEIYKVEEAPSWIDIVFDGDLACEKYNWKGIYSGGYFNSIIGNVGCKKTTDDFGYIVLGDDVWYFTGVTSVTADESNIGFILSNARTGEYRFYDVIGAEEHSAMGAAEGEVQEKGYKASFPSLVNISGQPTYIMVLKDAAGLVKLYALVNVENYSIVATGSTQAEAMSEYKKLLKQNNVDIGTEENTTEITVENVRLVSMSEQTIVYITATDGNVYKGYLESDESLILIRVGDKLRLSYAPGEHESIFIILSWEKAQPAEGS